MTHRICLMVMGSSMALVFAAGVASAQNPIASKALSSSTAERNRTLRQDFPREGTKDGKTPLTPREQRIAALEVERVLLSIDTSLTRLVDPKEDCAARSLGVTKATPREGTAVALLEKLCRSKEFGPWVPEAIQLADRILGDSVTRTTAGLFVTDARFDAIAWRAVDLLLQAAENGHTNPQRWYLGGQASLNLFGDKADRGIATRASARASYFLPISPFRRFQLPIVTNLGDVAGAPDQEQKEKLRTISSASSGAFLSIEPTSDSWTPLLRDVRVQGFLALGAQFNTVRDLADTSDVSVVHTRVGGGVNLEIGNGGAGRPALFISSRLQWRRFGKGAYDRAFTDKRFDSAVLETVGLIPIGNGTSVVVEVASAQYAAPLVRIGLWAQASPQAGARK